MDAPSTLFFNLERKNGQSRFIHSLRSEEGQELTEPVDIRKWAVRFYSELYRSQYKENGELDSSFYAGLPKVSEQLNAEQERPLDVQELHAALQSMEGGTAPGIDGLPVESYKAFWAELGADWLAVLNETLVESSLPLSFRRAVITLLPKKGDLQDIKNWRPDVESVLKISGGLSAPFRAERGIRQGCALSGMLYCLAIETLLNRLRSKIEGFALPQHDVQHCISAYADDVMVMINRQADIDNLVSAVRDFGDLSAASVNWQKSEAFVVGKWASGLPSLPAGMVWKRGGIKYLGVYLGDVVTQEKNWDGIVEKMEGRLARWKWIHSQLSFRGRVLIANSLTARVLWHRLSCVDPPVGLLARLQATLVDFFWDHLHWVPQGVLFLGKEEGGQGLVHLTSRLASFRVQFIQKYLTGSVDLVWRKVASVILRKADGLGLDTALFLMDCKQLCLRGLPLFYRGLFKYWALFKTDRLEPSNSLFWLLEEPLIKGSRLDMASEGVPGLTRTLCASNMVKLRHLVDARALASVLGQRDAVDAGELEEVHRGQRERSESALKGDREHLESALKEEREQNVAMRSCLEELEDENCLLKSTILNVKMEMLNERDRWRAEKEEMMREKELVEGMAVVAMSLRDLEIEKT
ncbi:hypothetical protein AOLI_G00004190 [Acnodon oligacanthus]